MVCLNTLNLTLLLCYHIVIPLAHNFLRTSIVRLHVRSMPRGRPHYVFLKLVFYRVGSCISILTLLQICSVMLDNKKKEQCIRISQVNCTFKTGYQYWSNKINRLNVPEFKRMFDC